MTDLLTVDETAAVLRVKPATVRRMLASGELPSLQLGGEHRRPVRISREALDEALRRWGQRSA